MIKIYDESGTAVESFYQWDSNRKIEIERAYSDSVQVHFTTLDGKHAYVLTPTACGAGLKVTVPNILLTRAKEIIGYVVESGGEYKTEDSFSIRVIGRAKPYGFEFVNNTSGAQATSEDLDNSLVTFSQQNAQVTSFLAEADAKYTDTNYKTVSVASSYIGTYDDPLGYTLAVKASGTIRFIDETDPAYSYSEKVSAENYVVYDLIPKHIYQYIVVDGSDKIAQAGRITSTGKVRMIYDSYAEEGSTDNIRDLGGWACDGGTVRYGVLYRGQIPCALKAETKNKLRDKMQIRNQIDMYTENKYLLYDSVNYSAYPLSDSGGASNITIGNQYYKIAAEALREAMSNASRGSATYIHCWSGADRTGMLCWMLLALLGVSEADCDKDYELTGLAGRKNRYRTANYGLPEYFLTLGSTVKDGVVNWCQKVGITEDEVNNYRRAMMTSAGKDVAYTWSITKTLANTSLSNSASTVSGAYTATVSASSGYDVGSVKVTMGSTDVTNEVYNVSTHVITISKVTGDVVITANGNKQVVAYTNILDTVGYNNGKYASEPIGQYGSDASYWATGVIEWDVTKPLYMKGWNPANASHSRLYASATKNGSPDSSYGYNSSLGNTGGVFFSRFTVETLGTEYVKITANSAVTSRTSKIYFTLSLPGTGNGKIITINEPIE